MASKRRKVIKRNQVMIDARKIKVRIAQFEHTQATKTQLLFIESVNILNFVLA